MSESALVVLTPNESKRLIARAVPKLPQVAAALDQGYLLIAGGTTNGYIAREMSGRDIDPQMYTVGRVYAGMLDHTPEDGRFKPVILKDGQPVDEEWAQVLEKLGPRDVFIKGANAIDLQGHAGILASNPRGGTIGQAWGILTARGVNLVIPVGLEKLIPSVEAAASHSGQGRFTYHMGRTCGLMPITTGFIFTELEALELLFDVHAVQVAAGGQGDSQGAVVISFHGADENVQAAFEFIKEEIKG